MPEGEPPNAEEVGLTLYPKTNARRDEYKGNQEGNLGADGTRCRGGSSVNEAQRMIVGMGAGLGLVNLLGLLFFLSKNSKPTKP